MKRILTNILIVALLSLGFSSCATMSKTGAAAPFAYTEVHPNEIRADLDFNTSEKVQGTVKVGYLLGIKVSGGNEYAEVLSSNNSKSIFGSRGKRIRSMAIAKAIHGTNYDMIINPQYETKRKKVLFGLFTRYTTTVTGYGATVNKLYQADSPSETRDIPLVKD